MWNNALPTESLVSAEADAGSGKWLALQFPELGLEVHGAREDGPSVLLEDQRIVACNAKAAAAGILCGSTLATARSICPDIAHFPRDMAKESDRLQSLAEAMYRFSSLVSVALPDALAVEVAGSRRLYADLAELSAQAVTLAHELGHRIRWQLARTPAAALVLARSGAQSLATVPLAAAGLPTSQLQQLASMGINQLGPLLALPEDELAQRFGTELVDFLGRVSGAIPDPREGIRLRPEFSRELHLLDPLRDKHALHAPMQQLLVELEHWLVARQLAAGELSWRFATQNALKQQLKSAESSAEAVTMRVSFGLGRQQKKAFLPITLLRLEQVELPADVITVALEALSLQPFETATHGLFATPDFDMSAARAPAAGKAPAAGRVPEELIGLLDELRARLGEGRCYGISSAAEHVPELAWRKRHGHESFSSAASPPAALRPAWLFDPPRRVERSQLTLLRGPERLQTAWWKAAVVRDYYLARHHSGAECWVYADAEDNWFLHGYFA